MAKSARRPRDDDEDEDERPARRARRDRDEVEDDDPLPRRARQDRDEVEDDDPPPRRKSRRDENELPAGTPTVYVHEKCKRKTEMPADVIREYLENPFDLGEEPTTTCTRCKEDVPWHDCYWEETEQNLYEYLDDLRGEMFVSGKDPRPGTPGLNWLLLILGAGLGGAAGAGIGKKIGNLVLAGAVGAVVGAIGGFIWMFIDRSKTIKSFEEWNRKLVKRYYKRHPEAQPKSKKKSRRDDD